MSKLDPLLERTSRTFALTIPLLPQPTRDTVGTAYLLFRIADTFEDSTLWSSEQRVQALEEFCGLLDEPSPAEAARLGSAWAASPPVDHAGYVDLLVRTPTVIEHFMCLRPAVREVVRVHVQRTARGMADYLQRTDGGGPLVLKSIADLRRYCYVVAGIVGEMLTELFLLDNPGLSPAADELRASARPFGEGLQLTNILKDALVDRSEGRRYVPPAASRGKVFGIARRALDEARRYVAALQGIAAPRGLIAFSALPVLLAAATLDRVEHEGPGSKLTRPEVFAVVNRMNAAIERGSPAID